MRDDEEQTIKADELFEEQVLLLPTVLLETAWVLASRYKLPRSEICQQLETLIAIETVLVSDPASVSWAMRQYRDGADFADMLHVATALPADRFATFDRAVRRHTVDAPIPVEIL